MKVALTAILAAGLLTPAADKCKPSAQAGTSPDGRIRVVPTPDWTFEWQERKEDGSYAALHRGTLTKVGHPHLYTYVADGGNFFIVNPRGGLEYENRIVLYKPDGTVVRSIGLKDILTEKELEAVDHSVSHLQHVFAGPDLMAGISERQDHFWIVTAGDRTIRLACDTGALIPEEGKK